MQPKCHTFNFTTRGRYWGQVQVRSAYGIISCEAIPKEGVGIERRSQLKWVLWIEMRGSHSLALDLLRFSTVPSVGFSRGMHCGRRRGSTALIHTVCRDPPSFHNLPLQSPGVFSLRQSPKATSQACFIFSSPLQLRHTDTKASMQ